MTIPPHIQVFISKSHSLMVMEKWPFYCEKCGGWFLCGHEGAVNSEIDHALSGCNGSLIAMKPDDIELP